MSKHVEGVERAERLVAADDDARIIGYQLGTLYPGFEGASRAVLAEVFERHGFKETGAKILDVDAERAVAAVVSRVGRARKDGLQVDRLEAAEDEQHVRAWGIYLVKRERGERSSDFKIGARVYVTADTIVTAAPVDAPEIPAARKLAEEIAEEAKRLLVTAETIDVSKAISHAVGLSGALGFISRGSYLAVAGFPGTARIVALFQDLRSEFYSESGRAGVRCSAVAVTEVDRGAVSDSVLDDLEERIAEAAERLRAECASGTVRATTITARRDEIAALAQQARERASWLGSRGGRLTDTIEALRSAYKDAVDATTLKFPESLAAIAGGGAPPVSVAPASTPPSEPAPAPVAATPEPEPAPAPAREEKPPQTDLFAF